MQPLNMIEMKVAQEEKGRFIESYEFINLMESVARIEDDNVLIGFNKNADCIACVSIIPSICSKKRYFHLSGQKPSILIQQGMRNLIWQTPPVVGCPE